MEKEKKSKGSLVVIIILIILLLGACAYIGYDKFFVKKDNQVSNNNENKGVEKLDVNSRLVQSLYNRVSTGLIGKTSSCSLNYMYITGNRMEVEDFYSDKASEQQKMKLVGNLLSESFRIFANEEETIPDTINVDDYGEYKNAYVTNKELNSQYQETYYTKEYVEAVYKSVYGKNAKLDTSAPIVMDSYGGEIYYYVPSIDKYALYVTVTGQVCPQEAYTELVKATKSDKELKIYEKIVTIKNDDIIDAGDTADSNYVYTFELEDDGMYKFVSRVKKD